MNFVLIMIYEFATTLGAAFLLFLMLRHGSDRLPLVPLGLPKVLLFSLYISAVFYVTGAGTLYDLLRATSGYAPFLFGHLNTTPYLEGDTVERGLNIFMFVPLGILLPALWPKSTRFVPTIAFALAFTLLIEASQLLNNRSSDINDLILNVLGALIGYVLFVVGRFIVLRRANRSVRTASKARQSAHERPRTPERERAGVALAEPALYVVVMFVGHFILFNERGLAQVLYGA